jgi:hypothetical protein
LFSRTQSGKDGVALREILEIRELLYGEFPEIQDLNPRFRPGGKKIKVVVDVHAPEVQKGDTDLCSIFTNLTKLLPSLEKHQCGEHLFENLRCGKKAVDSEYPDEITNIAHMMEHVIIDLQSNITGMNSCSGITCGYKNPSFRFDLFVECEDKKVGMFSAFFSADVLKRLITNKSMPRRYHALIDLAKYLYNSSSYQGGAELDSVISQINSEFGWRRGFALLLLRKLKEFGFLNLRHSPAT